MPKKSRKCLEFQAGNLKNCSWVQLEAVGVNPGHSWLSMSSKDPCRVEGWPAHITARGFHEKHLAIGMAFTIFHLWFDVTNNHNESNASNFLVDQSFRPA